MLPRRTAHQPDATEYSHRPWSPVGCSRQAALRICTHRSVGTSPGNGHLFWLNLATALNVAGVITAAVAALPGLVDWAIGIPPDSAAKKTGLAHAALDVTALGLSWAMWPCMAGTGTARP